MSVALSAVAQRSHLLLSALIAMAVFCLCITAVIGFGLIGALPVYLRVFLGVCCLLAVAVTLREVIRPCADRRIDISGLGQIHVTDLLQQSGCDTDASITQAAGQTTYRLLATSTLWSFLLILNLRSNKGASLTLIVLPDSMTQASFRALCVACQWIAAHNIRAYAENS